MTDVVHAPAVHGEHLRGDEARLRRGEKGDGVRDVVRVADASHHRALADLLDGGRELLRVATGHVGGEEARRDRIDRDAVVTEIHGELLRAGAAYVM